MLSSAAPTPTPTPTAPIPTPTPAPTPAPTAQPNPQSTSAYPTPTAPIPTPTPTAPIPTAPKTCSANECISITDSSTKWTNCQFCKMDLHFLCSGKPAHNDNNFPFNFNTQTFETFNAFCGKICFMKFKHLRMICNYESCTEPYNDKKSYHECGLDLCTRTCHHECSRKFVKSCDTDYCCSIRCGIMLRNKAKVHKILQLSRI